MMESRYWKEELKCTAAFIRAKPKPRRWTDRAHYSFERDIMIGFFILRRLIELNKVSKKTKDFSLPVYCYRSLGKLVTRLNRHRIEDLYDFGKETKESKKPLYIANQFIHSYTSFLIQDGTRNVTDMLIVSDFDRQDCIWRVPVATISELFLTASEDYPLSVSMVWDSKKGDYGVTTD